METLISYLVEPPEMDADEQTLEMRARVGFYESSKIDIIDSINQSTFKETWLVLKDDIQNESIKLQRIFVEQTLDKIFEIYDFSFPEKLDLNTIYDLNEFYKFLEFLEYTNTLFLSSVWKFLNTNTLLEIDIEKYCDRNADKIIRETEEQLQIHPQTGMITIFLRTYYKEQFIKWFIKNSEKSKIEITINILESKEK
jgi:hypothetical protein